MRRLQAANVPAPLRLAAEHAHEDGRVQEVLDVRTPVTVTNPMRGSLSSAALGEDLPNRLVHSAYALRLARDDHLPLAASSSYSCEPR